MVANLLCANESEPFFFFINFFKLFFIFINNQGRQRKMLYKLSIYCYLYQAKRKFYRTIGVRVMTVSD